MPPRVLNAAQLIADIRESQGNLAAVARKYGISRQAVWDYVQKHPTCKAAWESERDVTVDIAESALRKELYDGNIVAVIFTLKTIGKSRGYVEQVDQRHFGEMLIRRYEGVDPRDV